MTPQDICAGIEEPVLIVPSGFALDQAAIGHITRVVAAGGTPITDAALSMFDVRGRLRPTMPSASDEQPEEGGRIV